MKVAQSAAQMLSEHTTLELECLDWMHLNRYVPLLQTAAGAWHFFLHLRGNSTSPGCVRKSSFRIAVRIRSRVMDSYSIKLEASKSPQPPLPTIPSLFSK